MAKKGISKNTAREVVRKIDLSEYKRRQAAPGLKITTKAFGLGRRMPIAQRFTFNQ
jgi:NAD+ synthase (glutamine-hydrolysing)